MSASLIYHWRRCLLSAVAAGKIFHLPTYPNPVSIGVWQKAQGARSGKVTLWDHRFELPHKHFKVGRLIPDSVAVGKVMYRIEAGINEKLEIYDFPGEYAQRFDGVDKGGGRTPHRHLGAVLYVGGKGGGTYIHGLPPCNLRMCVLVTKQWDQLLEAIVEEKELSFSIEQ